jgi:hypothetical protein
LTFFKLFGAWLAIEVAIISTLSVIFTRVLFPMCIAYWDVVSLKKDLRKMILTHFGMLSDVSSKSSGGATEMSDTMNNNAPALNVCPFLFVSHRVAAHFPELLESAVIQGFRSCYPKRAFAGPLGVTFRQRSMYILVSILHSITVCVVYVVGLMLDTALGYQAASVVSWCMLGFVASLDSNILHFNTNGGVVFVIILLGAIVYVVNDMLKILNKALKEQNALMHLEFNAQKIKLKAESQKSEISLEEELPEGSRNTPLPPTLPFIGKDVNRIAPHNSYGSGKGTKGGVLLKISPAHLKLPSIIARGPDFFLMSTADKVATLELELKQADMELSKTLIEEEDEDPEVFQPWSELSMSLKAFFDCDEFFVDDVGQSLSRMALSTKFVHTQEADPVAFQREVKLTKQRQWRLKQWDQYRLCESEVILAFVDQHGHQISVEEIRKHRATSKEPTSGRSAAVLHCLHEKHISENNLLTFKEKTRYKLN